MRTLLLCSAPHRLCVTDLACCCSVQEEEAEQMMAPEDFVSEEERLREEREAVFAAEAAEVRLSPNLRFLARAHFSCVRAPSGLFLRERSTSQRS